MIVEHIVNVSGGKDSDCVYLLALERGRPFRAITADTGHEHPWTYDHIHRLSERTGGPVVEVIKQDFSAAIARRRLRLPDQWQAAGVPDGLIERALELLHPTGVPYLDLVLSKGMFAAAVQRKFCTEELKMRPSDEQVVRPALAAGRSIIQWMGIRADESAKRADVALHPRIAKSGSGPWLVHFRPILGWTIDDVLAMHRRHLLPMNPLYAEGFTRVGCFPCINERKASLAIIARRFPEAVEKLREWEAIVTAVNVSWRNKAAAGDVATFFHSGKVPRKHRNTIDDVMAWSLTQHGGKGPDPDAGLVPDADHFGCAGGSGWCEAA